MRTVGRLTGVLVALAAAGSPACGDGSGPSGSIADLAEEVCAITFRCCSLGEVGYRLGPFVDRLSCADRLRDSADRAGTTGFPIPVGDAVVAVPNVAVLERAVEEGRVVIDHAALEACLSYLRDVPCNQYKEPDDGESCTPPDPPEETSCDEVLIFLGRVREGGSCTSPGMTLECAEGLACRSVDSLGVAGVCVAPGGVGDYCFDDLECGAELYCSLLDGTCRLPSAKGEACLYANRDDLSPDNWTLLIACEETLYCDPVSDTCVGLCERGAQCVFDTHCEEEQGLVCIQRRCDQPRAAGNPCEEIADCADNLRCAYNPADFNELTCQELLGDGEDCNPGFPQDCVSGFCNPAGDRCAPAVAPGALCPSGYHHQCDGGYCQADYRYCEDDIDCDGSVCNLLFARCEYYCVAQLPINSSCRYWFECASESCAEELCVEYPLPLGAPCAADQHCDSEFCNFEEERVCDRLPMSNGSVCYSNPQCASGVCFNNNCGNPPCALDFFCDWDLDPPACVPLLEPSEICDDSSQCRGACEILFDRQMCDETPAPETAVCDGV